ncbi:MAG: hemolysin family protein [bacterium]|nr:hemolysin family protein [bacterium]MDT8395107.1 hemolysin family protein [bacterium]
MPTASVPTWEWVTILVCLLLSGFFSGSETAFVSLSKAKFQALMKARNRKPDPLNIWVKHPSALLTSILIGNNLVNIGASALATDIASRLFANRGLAVSVGVMTLAILVFGEITPKVMARRYAERFVLLTAWSLAIFYLLTWPATLVFTGITNLLIRATGGDPDRDFDTVQADEIQLIVSLSASEGGIAKYPAQLIDRVLAFHDRTVKDAMVPRTQIVALELDDGVEKVLEVANESGHSRFPVCRESLDEIVGVFYVKDLLSEPRTNWGDYRLAEHMHPPYFVPESAYLGRTIREFQKRKIHLALVVDEFGGTEGMITLEDILEELVGEIHDEFDREIVMMRRLPSGALEVSGRTPIDDLMRAFPSWSGETPSKTVGGLIMAITGRVPAPGETVYTGGLKLVVLGSDERQIKRVSVESTAGEEGGHER